MAVFEFHLEVHHRNEGEMTRRSFFKGLTAVAATIILSDVGLFPSHKKHPKFLIGWMLLFHEGSENNNGNGNYKENILSWRQLPFDQIECVVNSAGFYCSDVLETEEMNFYRVISKSKDKYLLVKI